MSNVTSNEPQASIGVVAWIVRAAIICLVAFELFGVYIFLLSVLGNLPIADGTPTSVLLHQYGRGSVVLGFWFLGLGFLTTLLAAGQLLDQGFVDRTRSWVVGPVLALPFQVGWIWAATHLDEPWFFVPANAFVAIALVILTLLVSWQYWRAARSLRLPTRAG